MCLLRSKFIVDLTNQRELTVQDAAVESARVAFTLNFSVKLIASNQNNSCPYANFDTASIREGPVGASTR